MTENLTPSPETRRPTAGRAGERRIVTVLFCDVAGSTALAENLDPEVWADIMNEAFEYFNEPVYRYGGTVARLMGDGALSFFGAPLAHEDDPERAILAGLAIVEGTRKLREELRREYGMDFNVRVGINTGPVVVGNVGTAQAGEYTAMGDAVNIAARMEQTAEPGVVQIARDTYELVVPLFDVETLGGTDVKGKSEPVSAYRVIRARAAPGRLRDIPGRSAALVGRDGEVEALRQILTKVSQGSGGIVCLIGEAGIGKSRLLDELQAEWRKLGADDASWVVSHGVSYDAARPYGLFMQRVRQVYGIEDNDSPVVVRDKFAKTPEGLPSQVQALVVGAVEALFAVGTDSDGPRLQGEALQHELYEACHSMWRAAASNGPTVLVLDDLHWADPASVELMIDTFPLVEELPLLILCSFRPERQSPAWRLKQAAETDYPHRYTEIQLNALSDEDCDVLFGNLLALSDAPPQIRQMILAKAEGNPLFLEEFTRTLIDMGAVTRDEGGMHWRKETEIETIPIPGNLQTLLISRIDRLEEDARHTLQLGSVIGRSFYHRVLKLVSDSSSALDKHLSTLQRAELIQEASRVPELEYMFRHDLTREAAYTSILFRRRREFHRRVGEAVEDLFSERLHEQAHRLAQHFYEAGDRERALKYSAMAGDASARLYANDEAITHYARAIELAREGDASPRQLIDLYTARGRAQEISGRYDDALSGYAELEALGRERGDAALELAALIPTVTVHSTPNARADTARARVLSERSLALAQQVKDRDSEARILWNLMLIELLSEDDFHKALEYGEQSLTIGRQHNLRERIAFTLHDMARGYSAIGRFAQTREALDESRELWRDLGTVPMLGDSLNFSAVGLYAEGRFDEADERLAESLAVSRSIDNPVLQGVALQTMAVIHLERGDIDSALAALEDGIAIEGATTALLRSTLAAVYGLLGAADLGLEQARVSLEFARDNPWWHKHALASLALAHLNSGDLDQAEATLRPLYEDAGMESKRNLNFIGTISALPSLLRCEIAMARQDYNRVLHYTSDAVEGAAEGRMRIFLPDRLRLRGQALLALGRVGEARAAFAEAHTEAEAQGSKRALGAILTAMSRVEALEGNQDESKRLLNRASDVIDYIVDRCAHSGVTGQFFESLGPLVTLRPLSKRYLPRSGSQTLRHYAPTP